MNNTKVALITGANKGIGKEIARQLGAQNHTVLIGARDAARGEAAAAELRESGLDAHFVALDLNDAASIGRAASDVESRFGRLDVLVNNPPKGHPASRWNGSSLRKPRPRHYALRLKPTFSRPSR